MLTLPPVLGPLAQVAHKRDDSPRYGGIYGIEVTATDTSWRAAATDLKRLVWVTGDHPATPTNFPALAAAPNGATTAVIPGKWWADVFKTANKCRGTDLGLVLSDTVATVATGTTASSTELVEGKFPAIDQIIPKRTQDVGCVIRFEATLMADTLKAMAAMSDPRECSAVVMEIRRPFSEKSGDKPFILKLDYPAAGVREVSALVMPMGVKGDEQGDKQSTKFYGGEGDAPAPDFAAGLAFDALRAERDDLRAAVGEWKTLAVANDLENGKLRKEVADLHERSAGQFATIDFLRADADRCNEMLARFRDETQHGEELIALWGRVGAAEQTARDAVAESERLRAELDAVRADRDKLLADIEALRKLATAPAHRPAPTVVHHRPAAEPGVRRTLGELAAMAKGGA